MTSLYDEYSRINNAKTDIYNILSNNGIDNIPYTISNYYTILNSAIMDKNEFDNANYIKFYRNNDLYRITRTINGDGSYIACDNEDITDLFVGNSVTNLSFAFYNCFNLKNIVIGSNVNNMYYAFFGCRNLSGNAYIYSNTLTNTQYCFINRDINARLNIYVHAGSSTNTYIYQKARIANALFNKIYIFTRNTSNSCYYNASCNTYVYYVNNVEDAYKANEL